MLVVIPMEAVTVEVAYALWILNLYPDIPALQSKTLISTVQSVCMTRTVFLGMMFMPVCIQDSQETSLRSRH